MVKGLTALKVILPLLFLLGACTEQPKNSVDQTESTKASTGKDKASVQHNSAVIVPAQKATKSVQNDNESIEEDVRLDYRDRNIEVLDISERSFDGGNAIAVTLAVPLNPEIKHDDYFSLTEKSGASVDDSIVLSKNNKIVYFPFVEPSNTYNLTVYKGLTGNNGSKLKKNAVKEIKTRPIVASYNFASKGSFLPLKQHNGLPIELVNINDINVDYFKVPDDQVVQFLSSQRRFQDKINRYYVQNSINRTELAYSARYQFDASKNKRRTFNLPIQNIAALSSPGIYLAVMTKANDVYQDISMTHFMVTDIGMHVRVYKDQLEVALNSLTDQKPLSGIEVSLLNHKGEQIDQFKSSPDGLGTLRTKNGARYIVAHAGSSISVVPLTGPALDLSEFTLAHRPFVANEIFVYSARDLYRPGEVIDFNALLRNEDGQRTKSSPLKASIKDPNGQTAKHFTWRSDRAGYFHQKFPIPSDAKTGTWLLEISKNNNLLTAYEFKVEEFLPERLKLTFNQGEMAKFYQLNDKLTVNVLGEYLYGAPAAGNRFESNIATSAQRQPFDALNDSLSYPLKGFQFGNVIEQNLSQQYKLPDVKLDADGKAAIVIENRWAKAKSPVEVTLQASLFETGGRAISRRHQTTVISGNKLIGIKPLFNNNPEHDSRISFDIVTTNAQGELIENSALDVKLVREDRRYFWEFNHSQGWHYRWSDSEFIEYNSAVETHTNKASRLEVPVEYGRYRLEVSDPETKVLSSVQFFAGYDWYSSWRNNQSSSQAARPDKVSLAWDKASYNAGDVAQLSIVPPKAGEALLLIESDQLLHSERITIPAEGLNVAITIDEKWQRHDIYASVVHLQYGDNKKRITPTRAIGLIHLPLNREPRRLDVEIESAEKVYPNQAYQVKVNVNGHANQQAKLTLAMVDVGVLSLTDFNTPDAHKYFFEPRRFQVDSRDLYQNLIELNDAPLAKQKFGGDAELSRGGKKAQAEVQILSLFSGLVTVDNQGYATVDFDIPDFNGRVRLMAMAFTDDKFGSAESEMTIAAPIVSQIAMPRFLATDDQSTFALDLHNLTEQTQTLTVALTTTDPVSILSTQSNKASSQEITLAAQEKTTLLYPVSVGSQEGRSKVSLSVSGVEGYPIDREWHIVVRSAYPALIEYKNTTLIKDQAFNMTPSDYAHLKAETLEAVLSVNNRVEFNSREQMKHLLKYPYGCLEQSTSATYPWLYANNEILSSLDLKNSTNKSRLESINHGLSRIQAKALKNGGYGLWSNTSQEEHWLTAYVGDFLTDAKEQGIEVDKQQYQNTMNRLTSYLKNQNGVYSNRWSESAKHYDFAYRAYAGYVLSRHNKASLSKLRDLAKHKSAEAESQLALIHLALALKNQGDDVNGQAMFDKAQALERGTKYLSDYGSVIRDQALIIHLLIKHKFQLDYAFATALSLSKSLVDKKYLSTQERNALFLASISLEEGEQKDWQASLLLNQAKSTIKKAGAFAKKLSATDLQQPLSLTNTSDERLYVNFAYQGVSKVKPQATKGDLTIARDYYDSKGKAIDASKLNVGDMVLVAIRVYSQRRSPDLLVVDLLPAGLELENQNLTHAIKLDSIMFDGKPASEWQKQTKVLHQEFRDDRYVAAIDVGYKSISYLFYIARAVTPGKYQVPAPLVENMYQPDKNAVGNTLDTIEITNL